MLSDVLRFVAVIIGVVIACAVAGASVFWLADYASERRNRSPRNPVTLDELLDDRSDR